MSTSSPTLRRFVRHALVVAGGESSSVEAVAAGFDSLCHALREQLEPVFGAVAVSALLARAVHTCRSDFGWLAEVMPPGSSSCSAEGLATLDRTTVSPAMLEQGLSAVLAREIELLTELIGHDVVMPLVYDAWGAPPPTGQTKAEGSQ